MTGDEDLLKPGIDENVQTREGITKQTEKGKDVEAVSPEAGEKKAKDESKVTEADLTTEQKKEPEMTSELVHNNDPVQNEIKALAIDEGIVLSKEKQEQHQQGNDDVGTDAASNEKLLIPGLIMRKRDSIDSAHGEGQSPSSEFSDKNRPGMIARVHPKLEGSPMKLILHSKAPNSQFQTKRNESFTTNLQSEYTQDPNRMLVSNKATYSSTQTKEARTDPKSPLEQEINQRNTISPGTQTSSFFSEDDKQLYIENRRSAPVFDSSKSNLILHEGVMDTALEAKRRNSVTSSNK